MFSLGNIKTKAEADIIPGVFGRDNMTPLECAAICGGGGQDGFAVTRGDLCTCFAKAEARIFNDRKGGVCDAPCTGDSSQLCGGVGSFDVYRLSLTGGHDRNQLPRHATITLENTGLPVNDETITTAGKPRESRDITLTGVANGVVHCVACLLFYWAPLATAHVHSPPYGKSPRGDGTSLGIGIYGVDLEDKTNRADLFKRAPSRHACLSVSPRHTSLRLSLGRGRDVSLLSPINLCFGLASTSTSMATTTTATTAPAAEAVATTTATATTMTTTTPTAAPATTTATTETKTTMPQARKTPPPATQRRTTINGLGGNELEVHFNRVVVTDDDRSGGADGGRGPRTVAKTWASPSTWP
ncbi:unnamed protein product [Ectocarpus sp. 12 AP-2014]